MSCLIIAMSIEHVDMDKGNTMKAKKSENLSLEVVRPYMQQALQ